MRSDFALPIANALRSPKRKMKFKCCKYEKSVSNFKCAPKETIGFQLPTSKSLTAESLLCTYTTVHCQLPVYAFCKVISLCLECISLRQTISAWLAQCDLCSVSYFACSDSPSLCTSQPNQTLQTFGISDTLLPPNGVINHVLCSVYRLLLALWTLLHFSMPLSVRQNAFLLASFH
jgi:hypothetical protein